MGISGLLPLLKSIQVDRHLSECAGQTLAVDAYVWLHRGVHACATELATGKRTNKYVDYAMHRVRLLRHHHIQPYVIFDGGPLPAKKGTEVERKQRRDENLAKGNALTAQGKHSQAREYYVKCVDVTPQMAFQLIKTLRAESVPYVVAPYEADAQMAYLERIGLVDGIITEDSDLLVYGCRKVYYKLDAVSATMTSISRSDFASVTDVSFVGWSDVQFRAMAILSGCDYLPSISGIGLKTAYTLMRKHKTVENVVRAVRLEGKKDVPKGYVQAFRLAEKVFLHQKVYDPVQEKLVNLTEIPQGSEWDENTLAYMGGDMDPSNAKKVALGDVDPVTLLPMEDINSAFVPRVPLNINVLNHSRQDNGKGKAKAAGKSASEGILHFFAPKSKVPARAESKPKSSSQPVKSTMAVGKASGKRTLGEVLDEDLAAKKKRREQSLTPKKPKILTESKFFGTGPSASATNHQEDLVEPVAGPSRNRDFGESEKENAPMSDEDFDFIMDLPEDPVTQEDGYISPSPSFSRQDTPDLSSPVRPANTHKREVDDGFDAEVVSSPVASRLAPRRQSCSIETLEWSQGEVLVRDTPVRSETTTKDGLDLRDMFDDMTSEIDCFDEDTQDVTPPITPNGSGQMEVELGVDMDVDIVEPGELEAEAIVTRTEIVANGWWEKWGRAGKDKEGKSQRPALLRRETNVTPAGRHSAIRPIFNSAPQTIKPKPRQSDTRPKARKSLTFLHEIKTFPKGDVLRGDVVARPLFCESSGSDLSDEVVLSAQTKLAKFRCNTS